MSMARCRARLVAVKAPKKAIQSTRYRAIGSVQMNPLWKRLRMKIWRQETARTPKKSAVRPACSSARLTW